MIDILDELIKRLYKAIIDADLEMSENTLAELEELGVGLEEAMDMIGGIATINVINMSPIINMSPTNNKLVLAEKNPETGEESYSWVSEEDFSNQPGSIFARNYSAETVNSFEGPVYTDYFLNARIDYINDHLSNRLVRGYNGIDILRMLDYTEEALGKGDAINALLHNGISSNKELVPDPEMRKLKVTKHRGYTKRWDSTKNMMIVEPCLRLDFNFYPLEGKL